MYFGRNSVITMSVFPNLICRDGARQAKSKQYFCRFKRTELLVFTILFHVLYLNQEMFLMSERGIYGDAKGNQRAETGL